MTGAVLTSAGARSEKDVAAPSTEIVAEARSTISRAEALETLLQSSSEKAWGAAIGAPELKAEFQERVSDALFSANGVRVATQDATTTLKSTVSTFLLGRTRKAREGLFNLVKAANSSITAVGSKFRDALVSAAALPEIDPADKSEMQTTIQTLVDRGICRAPRASSTSTSAVPKLNLLDGLKSFFFRSTTSVSVTQDTSASQTQEDKIALERLRKNQMQLELAAEFETQLLGARDRDGKRLNRGMIHIELSQLDLSTLEGQAAAKRLFRNYSDLLMNHYDIYRGAVRAKRELEKSIGILQGSEPAAPLDWVESVEELRKICFGGTT